MLQALIFDVDGTLADTEMFHLTAFNQAFAELGLGWHWSVPQYTELLTVSGGRERTAAFWKQTSPEMRVLDAVALEQTIARIHETKSAYYEQAVRDGALALRPGVLALFEEAARAGVSLAIATTTSPVNITTLLRQALGAGWAQRFTVIEDASTAPRKKPHPQVYEQTLKRLRLPAGACVAFEDSANGLQAATAAGLATVITPTVFTSHHDFSLASRLLPSLEGLRLRDIQFLLEQVNRTGLTAHAA